MRFTIVSLKFVTTIRGKPPITPKKHKERKTRKDIKKDHLKIKKPLPQYKGEEGKISSSHSSPLNASIRGLCI